MNEAPQFLSLHLINTGNSASDGERVLWEGPEETFWDLPQDWQPDVHVIEQGLTGPKGVPAVRVLDVSTGIVATLSLEEAMKNPRVGFPADENGKPMILGLSGDEGSSLSLE